MYLKMLSTKCQSFGSDFKIWYYKNIWKEGSAECKTKGNVCLVQTSSKSFWWIEARANIISWSVMADNIVERTKRNKNTSSYFE